MHDRHASYECTCSEYTSPLNELSSLTRKRTPHLNIDLAANWFWLAASCCWYEFTDSLCPWSSIARPQAVLMLDPMLLGG